MSQRVTLQTLAERLGVSRTTVSNAWSRPDQLSADLRERILDLAEELDYAGPDPAARGLRRGRADAIGLLLTETLEYAFGDPHAHELLRGVAAAIEEAAARHPDQRAMIEAYRARWDEMLAGEKPFSDNNPMAIIYKHRNQPVPRLPAPVARWQDIVDVLLAKRPGDRYASAAQAQGVLGDAAAAARAQAA